MAQTCSIGIVSRDWPGSESSLIDYWFLPFPGLSGQWRQIHPQQRERIRSYNSASSGTNSSLIIHLHFSKLMVSVHFRIVKRRLLQTISGFISKFVGCRWFDAILAQSIFKINKHLMLSKWIKCTICVSKTRQKCLPIATKSLFLQVIVKRIKCIFSP